MLVSGILGRVTRVHPRAGQPPRLGLFPRAGLHRAFDPLRALLLIGVANFFYIYRDELAKRLSRTGYGGGHDLHVALLGADHRTRDPARADRLGPDAPGSSPTAGTS